MITVTYVPQVHTWHCQHKDGTKDTRFSFYHWSRCLTGLGFNHSVSKVACAWLGPW